MTSVVTKAVRGAFTELFETGMLLYTSFFIITLSLAFMQWIFPNQFEFIKGTSDSQRRQKAESILIPYGIILASTSLLFGAVKPFLN